MSDTRERFVERFDEEAAARLEVAANEHGNGINDRNRGSDPFKWTLLIVIGYQCAEIASYRAHHGVTVLWDELRDWMKNEADLASHDGDSDYLALAAGIYNEYVGEPVSR